MTPLEAQQRQAVVDEARTWLRTPWHHASAVKGAGVDCAQLLYVCYRHVGLIPEIPLPRYPRDWHMHRQSERYMNLLLEHGREAAAPPLPGDTVMFRFGHCFSHGGLVVEWPTIIHAHMGSGCVIEDVERADWLCRIGENTEDKGKPRPRKFFRPTCWAG